MKKLGIIFMAVMIAAIAGCAGDDSTDPNGDLAVVQDLQLDATSAGTSIVLVWSEVTDVEGYKVYFKEDATGSYVEIGTVTGTTYTDDATSAGEYSVKAYNGENTSSDYATAVSTMPNVVTNTYTIYDNNSLLDSGFYFNLTSGQTGQASDPAFFQDIYGYDDSKGDDDISLYSGNAGSFGNGYQSYFQEPVGNGYCNLNGGWNSTSYPLYTGDNVVFVALTGSTQSGAPVEYVAKMRGLTIAPDPDTANGTMVTFSFEIQGADLHNTGLLSVFTTSY